MIAYEQAPNWVGVSKEIGEQSLQGVAWGRKTGLYGGGEGRGGGAVDFVLMPPIGLLAYLLSCNTYVSNMPIRL